MRVTPEYPLSKRLFDLTLTLPGLILVTPLLLILAGLVAWRHGRPVFFSQARPGLGGRIFRLYKFRSMSNARDRLRAICCPTPKE